MTSEAPKEVFISWPQPNSAGLAFVTALGSRESYTLTTHALAMVAAAYEDAQAEVATEWNNPDAPDDGICEHIMQSIRSRTPADAQSALDAALKAERVKALREAADCIGHITQAEDREAIYALIEKETDNE